MEGKRSGEGFVCHRANLIEALTRSQASALEILDGVTLGRKGFLSYIKSLGGSNMVKVTPSNGSASESQTARKGIRLVCGANTSYIPDEAWLTERNRFNGHCRIRVRRHNVVMPNLTPVRYRAAYEIYPGKACIAESATDCHGCLERRIRSLGRRPGVGPGGRRRAPFEKSRA